jgi:diguanylate cyclase (GGDEF)-like protein/PAS domain S-box-containing protein
MEKNSLSFDGQDMKVKRDYKIWFLPCILLIFALLLFIFISWAYPAKSEVLMNNVLSKGILILIALTWIIVIQKLSSERHVYIPLAIGFSLLFFGSLEYILEEFYESSGHFNELKNIGITMGMALASIGFYLWAVELRKARDHLEGQIQERTIELERTNSDLQSEITERKRSEKIREAFTRLGETLSAVSTPKEAAIVILTTADDLFEWDVCGVYFYMEESRKFYSVVHVDTINGERRECQLLHNSHQLSEVSQRALDEGPQLILRNKEDSGEQEALAPFGDTSKLSQSLMFAPIRRSHKKVGVITIQSYAPEAYSSADLDLFQVLADFCSGALERTNTEVNLRQSEERYRLLVESSLSILWEADKDTWQFKFISGQVEEMLGYSLDEWYKPNFWMEHIHPKDRGKSTSRRRLLGVEGDDYSMEYRMIKADGSILWILEQARILRDGNNQPLLIRGVFTDITKRKQADSALRESEARYRAVVEDQTEWICRYTPQGTLTFVNESYARYWSKNPEQMSGINFYSLNSKAGRKNIRKYLNSFTLEKPVQSIEVEVTTPNGDVQWQHWTDRAFFNEQGQVMEFQSVGRDITERKATEDALRKSRDELEKVQLSYQAILRSTPHGLCLFDSEWIIQYANHSMNNLVNPNSEMTQDLVGMHFERFFDSKDTFIQYTKSSLQSIRQIGMDIRELKLYKLDKAPFWCEMSVVRLDPSQTMSGYVATLTDITQRKAVEEELEQAALYDSLTKLPNRALFMDRLGRCHGRSKRRSDYQFAILYLDLDRFKTVNDSLGHLVGDELLQNVAHRLQECVREGDTVARWGGDEFAIILDDIKNITDATRIADRSLKELSAPFRLKGVEFFTSASIGIALNSTGYEQPQDILRDADTAMYKAKDLGRARYIVFDKTMHYTALEQLKLESGLRNALLHKEFVLYFQPIVALDTCSTLGFEALIRWQHPQKGMVAPEVFIPMAEDTGIIIPIGEWVLYEACQQLVRWESEFQNKGSFSISVNVSPKQYLHPSFIDMVQNVLRETRLEGNKLCLEVTETVLPGPMSNVKSVFDQLKALGVQLHLDDFGTGYSSLGYLHSLPIDALKIDRSFIMNMDSSPETQEIVRAIITLAKTLNILVIAEGVENKRHLEILREMECPLAQGNYFYHPMKGSDVTFLIPQMAAF